MQLYELGTINRPIIAGVERCPGLTTALPRSVGWTNPNSWSIRLLL